MAALGNRRGVNVGKDPSQALHYWQDRCAKMEEENRQLKVQRNDQEQLIKDLNTKFRKLMKDYRAMTGVTPQIDTTSTSTTPRSGRSSSLVAKLAAVEAQRDAAQKQLADAKRALKMRSVSAGGTREEETNSTDQLYRQESIHTYLARHEREALRTGGTEGRSHSAHRQRTPEKSIQYPSPHREHTTATHGHGETQLMAQNAALQAELHQLRVRAEQDERTLRDKDFEIQQLRASSTTNVSSILSSHHAVVGHQATDQSRELQNLKEKIAADAAHIEALKRERDGLEFKLRLKPSSDDYSGYRLTDADPQTLLTLQREVHDKNSQLTVLTSRFSHSQEQVKMLKDECDKLVEEVRSMHSGHAELKRKMFEVDQEKNTLLLKADRVQELEVANKLKTDEVMACEQKLLSMVDRLQSCSRETESQVRRQCNERFAELEAMRDEADRLRRTKERESFTLQQDFNDAKRSADRLREDVLQYKADIERLRKENAELQEKNSLLGSIPSDMTDDVHKAMTLMNLKKKKDDELDVVELWQGVEWNDGWEAGRMREAVNTAAFDLELADQRHTQLKQEVDEKTSLLKGIGSERDQLLDENIDLRRRLTGIQTTLTKRMLFSAKEYETTQSGVGSMTFTITHLTCDRRINTLPDGTAFTPTLFFTLDGLDGFELAMGETFCDVDCDLSTVFVFNDLPAVLGTLQKVAQTTFTLQLHQSFGTECDVIAAGTVQGANLLSQSSGSGVVSLNVGLVGNDGSPVGNVTGVAALSDQFLPFLLDRKFSTEPAGPLSPMAGQAAVLALRAICGLRITIFKASNLRSSPSLPQPYVFYTVVPGAGANGAISSFIQDSVAHPMGAKVTTDPSFEEAGGTVHRVSIDFATVQFLNDATLTLVVFDAASVDIESNLGMANIPLRPLLSSPTEALTYTETLHPQGSLEVGLAWVVE